jgi:hypothetical protein
LCTCCGYAGAAREAGEGADKPEDGGEEAEAEEEEEVGEWEAALEVVNDRVTTHWRALHQRFKVRMDSCTEGHVAFLRPLWE